MLVLPISCKWRGIQCIAEVQKTNSMPYINFRAAVAAVAAAAAAVLQGFASGDLDQDAAALRLFTRAGEDNSCHRLDSFQAPSAQGAS
jgi:hypothetical protein